MKFNWRKLIVVFVVVGTLAAVGGYFSGNWLLAKIRLDALKQNAGQIQLAIEAYAARNDGSYPQNLDGLVTGGYLPEWPENPFSASGERMQPLDADAAAQAGDFVYLPFGPVIFLGPPDADATPGEAAPAEGPAPAGEQPATSIEAEPPVFTEPPPTEVDQYFLVFYGDKGQATFKQFAVDELSGIANVDWDYVALVLTNGVPVKP